SLESSDYDQVLAAAQAYTAQIGKVISGVKALKDIKVYEIDLGLIKGSLKTSLPDMSADTFEKFMTSPTMKVGIKQNVLTFSKGFNAGAAYYFKRAKPSAPPKH